MSGRTGERGAALIEATLVIPLLLLLMVGIFEVSRALETWQVLTNAAREGARMAVTPNSKTGTVSALVHTYMANGRLASESVASMTVDQGASIVVNGLSWSVGRDR